MTSICVTIWDNAKKKLKNLDIKTSERPKNIKEINIYIYMTKQ